MDVLACAFMDIRKLRKFPDIGNRYQVRRRSAVGQRAEGVTGRHLVPGVLGVHPECERVHDVQPLDAPGL